MKIAEIFHSIQGEGKLAGLSSVFVRVSGCNIRCVWCDTPYASWDPQGQEMDVEQITRAVQACNSTQVVLTGGEPMIVPEIDRLCTALKSVGHHLTIETAGTIYKSVSLDLASISPKLSNSTPTARDGGRFAAAHESQRLRPAVIQQFIDSSPAFQLKFVLANPSDLSEIQDCLSHLHGWHPSDILLMPEGIDAAALSRRARWIADICKQTGFRYCPRLHIELFGNRRGT